MVVRFLKTTSWVITRILPKRQGQNCTLKNFREVDEDHNYVKARRAPLIPKISWELEKHESSTTATNAVACPRKKKYDLLKEKKAATVFENHRKSLIQNCERSELRLHFEWTQVHWKCQKWSIFASFWKPEACGQTVLPDRSVLIGQKLVENAKIGKFKCDILSHSLLRGEAIYVYI